MSGCLKDDGCDGACDGCGTAHVSAAEALRRIEARPEFSAWLNRVAKRAQALKAERDAIRVASSAPAYQTSDYEPLTIRDVI